MEVVEQLLAELRLRGAADRSEQDDESRVLVGKLWDLYNTADEVCRFGIIHEISILETDVGKSLLIEALQKDESPLVRHEAAFGLGWIDDESCISVLIESLSHDKSYLVRHEAAMALSDIGDRRALPALEIGLMDENHEVVQSCRLAIGKIKYRNKNSSL